MESSEMAESAEPRKDGGTDLNLRETPPRFKRLLITFSVVGGLLLCVPVWWATSRIYRAPLPHRSVKALSDEISAAPLMLPQHYHVVLVAADSASSDWAVAVDLDDMAAHFWEVIMNLPNGKTAVRAGSAGGIWPGDEDRLTLRVSLDDRTGCRSSKQIGRLQEVGKAVHQQKMSGSSGGGAQSARWQCGLARGGFPDLVLSASSEDVDQYLRAVSEKDFVPEPGSCQVGGGRDGGQYEIIVIGGAAAGPSGVGEGDDLAGRMNATSAPEGYNGSTSEAVVGQFRHAWIKAPSLNGVIVKSEIAPLVARLVGEVCFSGATSEGESTGAKMPLGADGRAVLSFSLLNAEPRDWLYGWEFETVEDRFLKPLIQTLSPVALLSVESQVLYYTPMAATGRWNAATQAYDVAASQWPFFMNSKEWHLDSSAASTGRSKLLHFALYIPRMAESPLHLRLPDGSLSSTNAFTSPSWGGILIFNPNSSLATAQNCKPTASEAGGQGRGQKGPITWLSADDLAPLMAIIVAQIRVLLGLPEVPGQNLREQDVSPNIVFLPATETGFAQWEVDMLLRWRAAADISAAASTLASLSTLVQSLPGMIVKDKIGALVNSALDSAAAARAAARVGNYSQCAEWGRRARAFSEEAFFDPSMMARLYFPLEHHLAVYTPLFVPVVLHAAVAFGKELFRHSQERKKYRNYLRSRAG